MEKKKLSMAGLKEELESVFSDYSFSITIEEVESYWNKEKAGMSGEMKHEPNVSYTR